MKITLSILLCIAWLVVLTILKTIDFAGAIPTALISLIFGGILVFGIWGSGKHSPSPRHLVSIKGKYSDNTVEMND